ncbi:MAG: arsenate reductase ArsC [Chitinophagaceae bacterium]|nr:MAG: arsenate reductase ArsC [Chitinophagaceae bacterium]
MKKVLVLCTGNSCRSQIAEGYLKALGPGALEVWSAGVETHGLNPRAVATMAEDGIDISGQISNHVDEYRNIAFDYVITVCDSARERCPVFPAATKQVHVSFPDPAKATGTEAEILAAFREVRDEIKAFCKRFALEASVMENK